MAENYSMLYGGGASASGGWLPKDGILAKSLHNERYNQGGRRARKMELDHELCFNEPDNYEQNFREDGEEFITWEPETRVPHCSVYHFNKEDHTLANPLREQLLKDPRVLFAAYKVPHPLKVSFDLRVQTDGTVTPRQAIIEACQEVVKTLNIISREFTKEYELAKVRKDPNAGA